MANRHHVDGKDNMGTLRQLYDEVFESFNAESEAHTPTSTTGSHTPDYLGTYQNGALIPATKISRDSVTPPPGNSETMIPPSMPVPQPLQPSLAPHPTHSRASSYSNSIMGSQSARPRTPRPLPQVPQGAGFAPAAEAPLLTEQGYPNEKAMQQPIVSSNARPIRSLPAQPHTPPGEDRSYLRPPPEPPTLPGSPIDPQLGGVGMPNTGFAMRRVPSYQNEKQPASGSPAKSGGIQWGYRADPDAGVYQPESHLGSNRWMDGGGGDSPPSDFSLGSSGISGTTGTSNTSTSYAQKNDPYGYPHSAYSAPSEPDTVTPHGSYSQAAREYAGPSAGYSTPYGAPGPSNRMNDEMAAIADLKGPLGLHEGSDDESFGNSSEEGDENRFVNLAQLSHLAVKLRDRVPRGTHIKSSIPYQHAFTGRDIVSTIQSQIQRELLSTMGISTNDRSIALMIARSLQSQLFFYEVEWGSKSLTDSVEDVFMFLDEQEGMTDTQLERAELPTGVVTFLTKCYASDCRDESPCYSYACPRRKSTLMRMVSYKSTIEETSKEKEPDWPQKVSQEILNSLPQSEIKRQTILHKILKKEEQYVDDLDLIEKLYLRPLRNANPPVIPHDEIDDFVDSVFGNVLDLRECNKRLLENMYVRQREQGLIIQRIGDIFLTAAAEFRLAYPAYVGHLPVAEKRLKDEVEANHAFKVFLEHCTRRPEARKLDLKHFLTRPSEHLQKYPVLLEAVMQETADGNPDVEYLNAAITSIKNLSTVATLRTFQNAMGKGPTAKLEWHDLVTKDQMPGISRQEAKRQSIIWELIQGEMAYVRDLELIETIFIKPLWIANPPIIPRERLKSFLQDVFHNYLDVLRPHRELLDQLHEIQREEHPQIRSITAPVFNAALNWTDAYIEYIPHHPIATYRVDEELANNPLFKKFVDQCTRHPDAHKLDIKSFIMRPVARLLRYPLLLGAIMSACSQSHDDRESIPQVLEVIKDLGRACDGGVEAAKQRVELWRYDANLTFRTGEQIDLDLRADTRSLLHTGKLLRQPDGSLDISGWTELFVLLFDNYMVMTKPKEKDGLVKYYVNRRPIPLELLSLATFSDPPQQRGTAFLKGFQRDRSVGSSTSGGGSTTEAVTDSRSVYPLTIHHNGRMGGLYTLYAESADARSEWKRKLEEALALRTVIQDSNKVFEIEPLSADTFYMPSLHGVNAPAWNNDTPMTGKVTCSVPFSTTDGRGLVAVGCAEGVWIGLRHDSKSLKRVLHLRNVTQCAMLEDFGIFLVLADKALFAYHIEALVPSGPASSQASSAPQRLNGNSSVQFFTVGTLHGRTLIIYMKKKGLDSVFRMLEPVVGKINERARAAGALARFGIGSQRSEWFRTYREFFLPSEAFDVLFLKAKIVILCSKGFEIMDLAEFKSETIPRRDDPRLSHIVKRLESCKPQGMYRSSENEFLLCYDELGLYVDRHGESSRPQNEVVVEWEGTAERVAFHPPYVLLFDSRFIEVRHIETGRLAQIIPGSEIRCTWDGRGTTTIPPIHTPGPDGWQESTYQEPRVHGVMKAQEPPTRVNRQRSIVQQVFELVPTIPLFVPDPLQAVNNASAYFPPPSPPSHSPNPSQYNAGWR